MKKLNSIVLFLFSLVIASCSSEVNNELESIDNVDINLKSIKHEFYRGNRLISHSTSYYVDNKLSNSQHYNDKYTKASYNENLISAISNYDSNDNLEWKTSYTYDTQGRLKLKTVDYNPDYIDSYHKHEIIYDNNTIEFYLTWKDGGKSERKIILDDTGKIKEELYDDGAKSVYTYDTNSNLIKVIKKFANQEIQSETEFNYLDKETSEFYNHEKLLFGDKWKNNTILNTQFGFAGDSGAHKLGNKYVSDYKVIIYITNGTFTENGKFEYEFDNNNNITKQIQHVEYSNGVNDKLIKTYIYN